MSSFRKWRPFWSFHIHQTERWLEKMGEKGYTLTAVEPKKSRFHFASRLPDYETVAITYDKQKRHRLPKAMTEDGWSVLATTKKWGFYANEKPASEVQTSVVRNDLIARNNRLTTFWWIFYGWVLFSLLTQAMLLGFMYFQTDAGFTRVDSPFWWITYTFAAVQIGVFFLGIYHLIALKKEASRLQEKPPSPSPPEAATTKKHQRSVIKPFWMYAPDSLERWLEKQEAAGWRLVHVRPGGFWFQFAAKEPRTVAYQTILHRRSDIDSPSLHRDAGWEAVYDRESGWQRWSIWRKPYAVQEEKPDMFDDPEARKETALRVPKLYTLLFGALLLLLSWNFFSLMLPDALEQGYGSLSAMQQFNVTIYPILIVSFLLILLRLWAYYVRERRRAHAKTSG
ncbi:DUF2812 domain-containing protein [Alkalicoccus chagannorensis]|uniref:DUF2812 domain-containing protein n=1 Tax=Alkalicoccus chagannorensis TaxID=427072 RepID=UPI0003FF04F4|nr:DUF2812 domain-containing protein [Alkalicoccus chagannorensis]